MGYAIDIVEDGPLLAEVRAMQNSIPQEQRLAVDYMAMTVIVRPKQSINQVILNALAKLPSGQFACYVTFWGQELMEKWLAAAIAAPGDARRVATLFGPNRRDISFVHVNRTEGGGRDALHARARRFAELVRPVAIQVKARPQGLAGADPLVREAIA
jgi:hypothetical protein